MGRLPLGPSCFQVSLRPAVVQRGREGPSGVNQPVPHGSAHREPSPATTHTNHFTGGWRGLPLPAASVFGLSHTLPCGSLDPRPAAPNPRSSKSLQPPTPPKARPASCAASAREPPAPRLHPPQSPGPLPSPVPLPSPSLCFCARHPRFVPLRSPRHIQPATLSGSHPRGPPPARARHLPAPRPGAPREARVSDDWAFIARPRVPAALGGWGGG